jgi:hypothetical protein
LQSKIGSKGFIDILARDNDNRYVVIEIKRSRSASRQTINEILKYRGLLKLELGLRDNEIRLIILSIDWEELIVPYSEMNGYTKVEGYRYSIDDNFKPHTFNFIQPIDLSVTKRNIAPVHLCNLFSSQLRRNEYSKFLPSRFAEIGFEDFLIVLLSNNSNKLLPYKFAVYAVWQMKNTRK